eukprot:1966897-Pyramimonas_sp.AAC.2
MEANRFAAVWMSANNSSSTNQGGRAQYTCHHSQARAGVARAQAVVDGTWTTTATGMHILYSASSGIQS